MSLGSRETNEVSFRAVVTHARTRNYHENNIKRIKAINAEQYDHNVRTRKNKQITYSMMQLLTTQHSDYIINKKQIFL